MSAVPQVDLNILISEYPKIEIIIILLKQKTVGALRTVQGVVGGRLLTDLWRAWLLLVRTVSPPPLRTPPRPLRPARHPLLTKIKSFHILKFF